MCVCVCVCVCVYVRERENESEFVTLAGLASGLITLEWE